MIKFNNSVFALLISGFLSQAVYAHEEKPTGCLRLENSDWDTIVILKDNTTTHLEVHVDKLTPDPMWEDKNVGIINKYLFTGYIVHDNKKMELDPNLSYCFQENYAQDPVDPDRRHYAIDKAIAFGSKQVTIHSTEYYSPFSVHALGGIKASFDYVPGNKPILAHGGQMIRKRG